MSDGTMSCTDDNVVRCGGCHECSEIDEAEAADRAAEAVTLESLIADPATLEAFARYLLDELRYTPDMLCAALGDPRGYSDVFTRWFR